MIAIATLIPSGPIVSVLSWPDVGRCLFQRGVVARWRSGVHEARASFFRLGCAYVSLLHSTELVLHPNFGDHRKWVVVGCGLPAAQCSSHANAKEASFAKVQLGVSVECRWVLGVSDDSIAKESLREARSIHHSIQQANHRSLSLAVQAIRTFIMAWHSCEIQ